MLSSKIVRWKTKSKKEPVRIGTTSHQFRTNEYIVERPGYIDKNGIVRRSSSSDYFYPNSQVLSPLTGEEMPPELIAYLRENSIYQEGNHSSPTPLQKSHLVDFILTSFGFDNQKPDDGTIGGWISITNSAKNVISDQRGVAIFYWAVAALVKRGCTDVFLVNRDLHTMIDLPLY